MKPYIGVTGFTRSDEIHTALDVFPDSGTRALMVGVLVSWKSLRNAPLKPWWRAQYPDPQCLSELFLRDGRVENLVHYSTHEGWEHDLLHDLLEIHRLAGANLHGFQLNVPWPPLRLLEFYRLVMGYRHRMVLQIGRIATAAGGGTPEGVVERLERYVPLINDVLFDLSGGYGRSLDVDGARRLLSAIAGRGWRLGLGVAGGLGPHSLDRIVPLVEEFPNLNIDAQGRLRDKENNLDHRSVQEYLRTALQLFT